MSWITIDLEKFDDGPMGMRNIIVGLARERGAVIDADPPESIRVADMDTMFKFAEAAKWSPKRTKEGSVAVSRDRRSWPNVDLEVGQVLPDTWLDSDDALLSAGVLSLKRGTGLRVNPQHTMKPGMCVAIVYFDGINNGASAEAPTVPRAAVLACIEAFGAK